MSQNNNIGLILLIIGILMAIFFTFDAIKNPNNYSDIEAPNMDMPPAWCSGIYCD